MNNPAKAGAIDRPSQNPESNFFDQEQELKSHQKRNDIITIDYP